VSDDKDNIRVDLLKFRRKAYLTYPVGSEERKIFLKAVLKHELMLTERDVPQDLINLIIEGGQVVFWDSMKHFLLWLGASTVCGGIFAWLYTLRIFMGFGFLFFGVGCLTIAVQYLYEYWRYCKSLKTVKKYSNDMQQYINKISNDIKRLEGPR